MSSIKTINVVLFYYRNNVAIPVFIVGKTEPASVIITLLSSDRKLSLTEVIDIAVSATNAMAAIDISSSSVSDVSICRTYGVAPKYSAVGHADVNMILVDYEMMSALMLGVQNQTGTIISNGRLVTVNFNDADTLVVPPQELRSSGEPDEDSPSTVTAAVGLMSRIASAASKSLDSDGPSDLLSSLVGSDSLNFTS
jgi:hypothetical protein